MARLLEGKASQKEVDKFEGVVKDLKDGLVRKADDAVLKDVEASCQYLDG